MTENIVAICDCDFGLLEARLKRWQDSAEPRRPNHGRRRRAALAVRRTARQRAEEVLQRRWQNFGASKAQRAANTKWAQTPEPQRVAPLRRRTAAEAPEVSRLPRDAREAEGHRRRHRRHARPHACGDRVSGDVARQARVRAEADVLVGARSAAPGEEGGGDEGRHADGQSGPLAGRSATRPGLSGGQGHRRRHAKCTSGPIARSRSGRRACRGRRRSTGYGRSRAGTTSSVTRRLADAMVGDYPVPDTLSWDLFLGVAPDVEYHPLYHPFNWRGWVDWGQGALGDMGAHLIDHPVWGLKLGLADGDRDDVDAVQRRLLSERDQDGLSVPCAQGHAGGEARVVRRRPHAAAAGGARRREAERRRRDPLHRQQGQDAAADLRRSARACCRSRSTTTTARRRRSWRASRTSRTK